MADTTDQEMTEVPQNGNAENGGDALNDVGDNERKMFVGRLSWETTEKELQDHFAQFGEIDSVSVKTDPATGRSRGFAFVVFKDIESLNRALEATEHVINNKKVDPKKAKARHGKIFVGGLDIDVTEEEIREYFGKFGTIVEVELPIDKMKNQRKNFCFVTFESESVTNEILKNPKQTIKSKEVDVKKANPKGPEGMRGGRGGRGGPRGGRGGRGGGWGQGFGGYGNGGYGYGGGYGGYDYYGNGGGGGGYGGYNGGYGDYSGGYNNYNSGYGDAYGYGGGDGGYSRGGPRGGRGGKGFGGGKQRGGGGGRGSRPAPY